MQMSTAISGPFVQLRRQYEAAYNSGDASALAALFTEDAVLMPPDAPASMGREGVKRYYQTYFDQFERELSITQDEVVTFGERVCARGEFQVTLKPRSGGESIRMQGKWMNLGIIKPDGSIQLSRHIWNVPVPVPGLAR
jgi:uncharacterized protein (TIGR02246 family)